MPHAVLARKRFPRSPPARPPRRSMSNAWRGPLALDALFLSICRLRARSPPRAPAALVAGLMRRSVGPARARGRPRRSGGAGVAAAQEVVRRRAGARHDIRHDIATHCGSPARLADRVRTSALARHKNCTQGPPRPSTTFLGPRRARSRSGLAHACARTNSSSTRKPWKPAQAQQKQSSQPCCALVTDRQGPALQPAAEHACCCWALLG